MFRLQKGQSGIEETIDRHITTAEEDTQRSRRRPTETVRMRLARCNRTKTTTGGNRKTCCQSSPVGRTQQILHICWFLETRRGKSLKYLFKTISTNMFIKQDEEVAMLTEMGHLQEAVQQLEKHTADPSVLPPASEQVIADLKSSDSGWSFQTPPSSPSSLGSRKSSMCSISSLNSSSSGSSKSHHSPSHPHWQRSLSQVN